MQKILQSASTNGKRAPPLRDYQAKTLQLMKDYDGQAALCNIATGLGKTRIYTEYIRWDVSENDHHVLILSHREELVRQPLEYLKDLPCGIELGPLHADGEPIISASVQSLVGRLSEYNPYSIDTIIIDEAHHSAAPTYRKIFEYFKNAVRFGFTATSVRGDGVGLAVVFKEILCEFNTLYGIEHGYLSPIDACQVNLKFDLGTVQYREDTGDYDAADIARVMSGTAAGIAEAYTKNARGQTIIFAPSIEEGKNVTALLNSQHGASTAAFIDGTTQNRGHFLEAYRLGLIKVLVCYAVLTEGVDLPMTETVVLARPIARTNVGLYAQMVGRGLRLYPGKASCKVIDCVGVSNMPICTAATLIGKDVPAPKPEKEPTEKLPEEQDPIKVLEGNEIPDSWIKNQKEVNVMALGEGYTTHDVAWLDVKGGGRILPLPNVVYRISKPLPNGMVYLRKNKKCSRCAVPLQFVLDYVYQDLKQNHPQQQHIWDKKQRYKWDRQPITSEQISLIHKLAPDYKIDTKKMTRTPPKSRTHKSKPRRCRTMPRKARERSATGCYHIMGRGINHAAIYNDDADNMNFLHILDFCADEDFTIFAYCLMGNHFHLLAKADADVLQHVMKAVGIRYVAYFNRRYQRDGPLFRGRYNSQPVTTKGYFLRVLRYIHRNPVAAGIVQEMQDYPWSSYLDYFGSRKKVLCQVDTSYALALHGLEWLRSYHQRPELNTRGMLEDSPLPAFTDTELRSFIRMTAGMECHEIPLYPETITTPLLRRLVEQEGAGISQLARLTGLARGDIRRRLL